MGSQLGAGKIEWMDIRRLRAWPANWGAEKIDRMDIRGLSAWAANGAQRRLSAWTLEV